MPLVKRPPRRVEGEPVSDSSSDPRLSTLALQLRGCVVALRCRDEEIFAGRVQASLALRNDLRPPGHVDRVLDDALGSLPDALIRRRPQSLEELRSERLEVELDVPSDGRNELGCTRWIRRPPVDRHATIEAEKLLRVCTNFVTTSPEPEAQLERTLATVLAEARAQVAAAREPNTGGFETRIIAAARLARSEGADAAAVERAAAAARRRLATIASVHRARSLVLRQASPPPPAATPPRRAAMLQTKPTITGSLDVRRAEGDGFRLVWDAVPAVTE